MRALGEGEFGGIADLCTVKVVQEVKDEETGSGDEGCWKVAMSKTSEKKRRNVLKKMAKRMVKDTARSEKVGATLGIGEFSLGGDKMATSSWNEEEVMRLNVLGVIEPLGVKGLEEAGEWEELEMAVDSGAGETVIEEDALGSVAVVEGEALRKGVKYEVADGTLIDNMGEKRFVAIIAEGHKKKLVAQVCGVNKSLLSVKKVTAAGNTVVFKKGYGWIEDDSTGEKIWMEEREGMYMVKLWVPKDQSRFGRQE